MQLVPKNVPIILWLCLLSLWLCAPAFSASKSVLQHSGAPTNLVEDDYEFVNAEETGASESTEEEFTEIAAEDIEAMEALQKKLDAKIDPKKRAGKEAKKKTGKEPADGVINIELTPEEFRLLQAMSSTEHRRQQLYQYSQSYLYWITSNFRYITTGATADYIADLGHAYVGPYIQQAADAGLLWAIASTSGHVRLALITVRGVEKLFPGIASKLTRTVVAIPVYLGFKRAVGFEQYSPPPL